MRMKAWSAITIAVALLAAGAVSLPAVAEESQAELAKKSLNPVASLISVPLELDYDRNIGPLEHGNKYQLTVQLRGIYYQAVAKQKFDVIFVRK